MKFLLVGDLHTVEGNIPETLRFRDWLCQVIAEKGIDCTVFMGDQYHNHSTIKTQVLDFYLNSFFPQIVKACPKTVALVGNHDKAQDGLTNAMVAHKNQITVVDAPTQIHDDIWGVPFMRSNEDFAKLTLSLYEKGCRILLCHQTFDGAKLENGFYAPGGVSKDLFPADMAFIDGHIHGRQLYDGLIFVGTPRQLTRSDIGTEKGVTAYDSETGLFDFIPTPEEVCETFKYYKITQENADILSEISFTDRVAVDVIGDSAFVKKIVKKLPDSVRYKVLSTDTQKRKAEVKESEGIPEAFSKYAKKYFDEVRADSSVSQKAIDIVMNICPILRGSCAETTKH